MSKTAREWADYLPGEIRARFLRNCEDLNKERVSLGYALQAGFIWEESNEGREFWSCIRNDARNGKYNKRLYNTKPPVANDFAMMLMCVENWAVSRGMMMDDVDRLLDALQGLEEGLS